MPWKEGRKDARAKPGERPVLDIRAETGGPSSGRGCGLGMRRNKKKRVEGRHGPWLEGTHNVDGEREPYLGLPFLAPGCRMVLSCIRKQGGRTGIYLFSAGNPQLDTYVVCPNEDTVVPQKPEE